MSEQQRQHLSALVDGEIEPVLAHATLSALETNPKLKESWERYHLIGAAIRWEPVREEYRTIAERVKKRIALEPAPMIETGRRRGRTSRLGTFAGAALAASAAFLAIFAVPQLFNLGPDPAVSPRFRIASPPPQQFQLPDSIPRWHLDEPALENKLDRFLVTHQEQSPTSGMKGFLPYATFVAYGAGR
jgi:sigma-E factor negative regulatory protein RseA